MKVLIISHNPITTYQNMGKTFLSLFSAFDKNELCQLYVYPTIPDIDVCHSYFRMTDRDILKSFFRFGKISSRVIQELAIDTQKHSIYENEREAVFYKKNKKNSATLICRDLMWSLSHWYSAALKKWLNEENPTCIFLAPGESKFIYNIAMKIARKRNIPLYTYICDDYYFVNVPSNSIDRIQLYLLKLKIKRTLTKGKAIITICDELADLYHNEFETEVQTIYTGTNYSIAERPTDFCDIKGFTYMGNLSCNRFVSIAEIGMALDRINSKTGSAYQLFLYSTPLDEAIQKLFSTIRSIYYCGYVVGEDFERCLHTPTVLLHVEAFDPESVDRVKHSISTKIADSLGSGNLLFAYGPDRVASIRYLISNECAVVATCKEELEDIIESILSKNKYESTIRQAILTAKRNHYSYTNSRFLHDVFCVEQT